MYILYDKVFFGNSSKSKEVEKVHSRHRLKNLKNDLEMCFDFKSTFYSSNKLE